MATSSGKMGKNSLSFEGQATGSLTMLQGLNEPHRLEEGGPERTGK